MSATAKVCAKCGREGSRGFRVDRLGRTVCTQGGICTRRKRSPKRALELRVSDVDYQARLEAQGGGCAICGRPPSGNRRLDVDHDHATGEVRGLLCWTCNHRLLTRGATADKLMAASMYLRGHARTDGNSWLGWVSEPA